MHYFFDESGDFGFPSDRFDAYTQVAVICPDSRLEEVRSFVSGRCELWELDELHAADLTHGERMRVCRYLAESDLQLVVQAIDSELTSIDTIKRWRHLQAQTLRKNLDWYPSAGGAVEEIEQWMTARAKGAQHDTRISNTEFIQATLLVDLIHAALQKSLFFFFADRWRHEFETFSFILDGKLPGKLGPGEKYLQHAVVPVLGSNPKFALELVDAWKDAEPPHPFIERFERSGGWSGSHRRHVEEDVIDLKLIFDNGLQFEPSNQHAGLQLADLAAYSVRQAILHPEDARAQMSYDLIRPKLRRLDGTAIVIAQLNTTRHVPNLRRYLHLRRA